MERIFANLYRCGSTPNKRGMSHSYLLVRKEGNLLVCHQSGPGAADMKEIKKLGGIDGQFICHNHDTLRNGLHEELHAKFGCELHHHLGEKKAVRNADVQKLHLIRGKYVEKLAEYNANGRTTTWLLVRISPSARKMTPDPRPSRRSSCSPCWLPCGGMPNQRSKNSLPRCGLLRRLTILLG